MCFNVLFISGGCKTSSTSESVTEAIVERINNNVFSSSSTVVTETKQINELGIDITKLKCDKINFTQSNKGDINVITQIDSSVNAKIIQELSQSLNAQLDSKTTELTAVLGKSPNVNSVSKLKTYVRDTLVNNMKVDVMNRIVQDYSFANKANWKLEEVQAIECNFSQDIVAKIQIRAIVKSAIDILSKDKILQDIDTKLSTYTEGEGSIFGGTAAAIAVALCAILCICGGGYAIYKKRSLAKEAQEAEAAQQAEMAMQRPMTGAPMPRM